MKANQANARRIGGDLYDVTYPGSRDYDRSVSGAHLRSLTRQGYTVVVDQRGYRGEGEPETLTLMAH